MHRLPPEQRSVALRLRGWVGVMPVTDGGLSWTARLACYFGR